MYDPCDVMSVSFQTSDGNVFKFKMAVPSTVFMCVLLTILDFFPTSRYTNI